MTASRPPQPDRNRHRQNPEPYRQIVAAALQQHQPGERNEDQAVPEEMSPVAVAEGSCDHPQQRSPGMHRQVPAPPEQELIDEVRAAGVLLVASAGNGASSVPSYPAAYDGVIAVSAVGPDKARAPYSSFGSFVDVTAPGGNLSLDLDKSFGH